MLNAYASFTLCACDPHSATFRHSPYLFLSNNTLYQGKDGAYGSGQTCTGAGTTIVHDNTIWSPTGAITECGTSLANWQAQGHDLGTTAGPYPADSVVLAIARGLLGV